MVGYKVNPKFVVYCGPMFSSKSTRLIADVERYNLQGRSVVCFKPKMDERYQPTKITTHNGASIEAQLVVTGEDIVDIIDNLALKPDVVAVDEAFMIENSSTALVKLFKRGIHIVVSSIDLSASCTPFTEVAAMLPFATNVVKCTAVCTSCGTDAPYTKRKFQNEDDEIVVGGSELYEPSCFEHHIYFQN
jgi:thymidine kinase